MEVVFANLGSTADQHIISRINRYANPRKLLVVSSDREIQNAARSRGARVITSEEFSQQMVRTHAPKHKRRRPKPKEQNLSRREVEEWLSIFQNRSDK